MTAQDVLTKVGWEIGQRGDQVLWSDQSALVQQLVALMIRAADDIAYRTEWQKLHRELVVDPETADIVLPADFRELAESGAIRINVAPEDGSFKPVRVITAPEQWDLISARPSAQHYCYISNGRLKFSPNTGALGAKVRYVSKFWNANGTEGIGSGTDTFHIPERLIVAGTVWRWRRQKGFEFTDLHSEYEADLLEAVSADRGVA